MVAPASQSVQRKSSRRLRAVGKLTALLGLPLALVGAIFGGGLYFGATHAYRVEVLEARFLGFPEPARARPAEPEQPTDTQPSVDTETPQASPDAAPEPQAELVERLEPQPAPAKPKTSAGLEVAKVEPIGEELRAKFDARREVHVKIMLDPALAAAREDWPSYTNELFTAVSASFSVLLLRQSSSRRSRSPAATPSFATGSRSSARAKSSSFIIGILASWS